MTYLKPEWIDHKDGCIVHLNLLGTLEVAAARAAAYYKHGDNHEPVSLVGLSSNDAPTER